ncbi:hypothetical protein OIU84_028871 [Salix udensis]|uniref:Pentatricopeptide repeat-containing protein n=1 Tax=Salix udensis TaxID=889485 RepID=A0AAD6KDL2_9ROSI|nr:hypothetical protein OIU84_028871 [Salix udensis]
MAELLRNSMLVTIKELGLACQKGVYLPNNGKDRNNCRSYCCGGYGGSAMKTRRIHVGTCELNVVSVSMKGLTWFGCVRLKKPQMSLQFVSVTMRNSLIGSGVVACNESELVSEDNRQDELVRRGIDQFDMDPLGQKLPPWGIVSDNYELVSNEKEEQDLVESGKDQFDMDSRGQNFPLQQGSDINNEKIVQSPSLLNNRVTVNESRVLFLEETDENELSRRILMLSRSNKIRSALELLRSMEFSGLQPNIHACNSLLSCLVRHELHEDALRVFEFMKKNEITTGHAYSLILKTVAGTKGCDSALDMFVELEAFSRERKDFDVIVYNTMISVCGKEKNWVETERIWRSMKENDYHGTQVTYSLLVSIFVRCGRNELAIEAYSEMVQNGLKPREDTMHAAIGACSKKGNRDLALNIFQNMLDHGLKPNLIACNALINLLGKAGEIKLAFKVFKILKSLGHTPDEYTWNALLSGLYRAKQHVYVLQLFERIKREQKSQLNEHLYNTALMSCQKLGLWDRALQLVWQVEASGLSVSTASYNLVIGACEVAKKPKVALEVYEHMVHRKCPPDTFTYLSLIRSCIRASLWDEVEEILDRVAPDVSLYKAVIHGMCSRGNIESAKKLYMKMGKSGLKPDGDLMLQNLQKSSSKSRFSTCRR